jgi:23S rRNA (pseudouridine1915-N3)-methyltransferase
MKLHIITVGRPKLSYAKQGWEEYWDRLKHYHKLRVTHIDDKHCDTKHILAAAGNSYKVALSIKGRPVSSEELAGLLEKLSLGGREVSFMIGGPNGLPREVVRQADYKWSFGPLTYPHDLAMVMLLESLYRASTINAGHPYHRGD